MLAYQAPGEKKPYRQRLDGDVITASEWTIDPPAILEVQDEDSTTSTVLVSGLAEGRLYRLVPKLTGATGQVLTGAGVQIYCTYNQPQ